MTWTAPPKGIREKYTVQRTHKPSREGCWDVQTIEILLDGVVVHSHERSYPAYGQPEFFHQDGRDYALVSHDYTATSVADLASGEIIAGEEPGAGGFCPVEWYVPDWWDCHDDSVAANPFATLESGRRYWTDEELAFPGGQFGFVAGCVWGDDSSWKVQYLDLSRITEGVLGREERFGYVELAGGVKLSDAVRVYADEGNYRRLYLAVQHRYDLNTGALLDPLNE